MKRIVVFCGASSGIDPIYEQQAYLLGKTLAAQNIELVYGGAKVGVMGAVANGVMENNGKAIGVLPRFMRKKEVAHEDLTELILVDTMHERKKIMNDLSDGIITLAGGFGTLEEFFEMLTWAQLGLHPKPTAILNTNGYYNDLLTLIDSMIAKGFVREDNRQLLLISENIADLLEKMRHYQAPPLPQWLTKDNV